MDSHNFFIFLYSSNRAISEQKVRMKRLGTDLTSAQKDMKAKHKAYENAVGILSRRLQEALTDKETAEAELVKLKAQVSDGGNSQALQVEYNPGHNYPVWGLGLFQNLLCCTPLFRIEFLDLIKWFPIVVKSNDTAMKHFC